MMKRFEDEIFMAGPHDKAIGKVVLADVLASIEGELTKAAEARKAAALAARRKNDAGHAEDLAALFRFLDERAAKERLKLEDAA
ncbi:hypothetical protein [Allohahella sp. A8]|uniref:hypothetical protein n=1 Tax=Allohahella sp. A8 TaxID=3141461 RepID=UPI003A8014C0